MTYERKLNAWMAFENDRPVWSGEADFYNGARRYWLFRTRRDARKCAQDVRKVIVTICESKKP